MVPNRCSPLSFSTILDFNKARFVSRAGLWAALLLSASSLAQQTGEQPAPREARSAWQATSVNPAPRATTVTVPAGTSIALVLTHPIQSRYIHRGDDIYAQVVSPITSGDQVVIPAGTLVNGKFDRVGHHANRGELYLQSMSIVFPDGYVAPVAGPITLESTEGYAWNDPGNGRVAAFVVLPLAGTGVGALIGHSAASSQGQTITSTLPPGCTGPPPGCLTSSVTGPPDKGKGTVIGAGVGAGIGLVAALVVLGTSHHFFLDVGTPVEMVLEQPLTLQADVVADAVRESQQQPMAQQPVVPPPGAPRWPVPPPNSGICYTPGTPETPDVDIPGTPAIGNSPGTPPVHIPGTPPTPPTPYPCP